MALKWPEEIVIYLVDKIIWHFLLPDDASILLPDRLYFNVINRPMYSSRLNIEKQCNTYYLYVLAVLRLPQIQRPTL